MIQFSSVILYSFDMQFMLILILIDVQYSKSAVFIFEKYLNHQNHSSSGSHHLVKKCRQQNFQSPSKWRRNLRPPPLHPLLLFGKPCLVGKGGLTFSGGRLKIW